jgi:hypothetical protein
MANELQVTGSLTFSRDGIGALARAVTALNVNVNGVGGVYVKLSIANVDTTLQLGGLAAPFGWSWFHNLDAVNAISIRVAAASTKIIRLLPGEFAFARLDSGITAPVAIADAGTPLLEYILLPP